jgi:hypothetical protein
MEVNGQLLAPATSPLEDQPPAPTVYEAGWAQNSCVAATEKKSILPMLERNCCVEPKCIIIIIKFIPSPKQ